MKDLRKFIATIICEHLNEQAGKFDDKVGKEFWFEYHCLESDVSCDAEIWYRSHQKVKVLKVIEWSHNDIEDRIDDGYPRTYQVQFVDDFLCEVFEDELMVSPNEFHRPNPPKKTVSEKIK